MKPFVGLLITAVSFVGALLLFTQFRLERSQRQANEQAAVSTKADQSQAQAIRELTLHIQSYDQLSQSIKAFLSASHMVHPEEFRKFLMGTGVFQGDAALSFVGFTASDANTDFYSVSVKGFNYNSDLIQISELADGSVFNHASGNLSLVRSFPLPNELIAKLTMRPLPQDIRIVMLIDVSKLLLTFTKNIPSLVKLDVSMGTTDNPDRSTWQQIEIKSPGARKGSMGAWDYDLSLATLSWKLQWTAPEKKFNPRAASQEELASLGLAGALLVLLLYFSWIFSQSKSQVPDLHEILQAPLPVWRVDAHGFIVDLNQAALVLAKLPRNAVVGQLRMSDITQNHLIRIAGTAFGLEAGDTLVLGPVPADALPKTVPNPSPVTQAEDKKQAPPVSAKTQAAPTPEAAPEPATPAFSLTDGFDVEVYRSLAGPDLEVMEEVRKQLLQSLPQQFIGLEALAEKGQEQPLMLAAHTLKSNLALLGSKAARDICFRIENKQLEGKTPQEWLKRLQPLLQKILQELQEASFSAPKPDREENPFKRKRAS